MCRKKYDTSSLSDFENHLMTNNYTKRVVEVYTSRVSCFLNSFNLTHLLSDEEQLRKLIVGYTAGLPLTSTFGTIQAALHAYYHFTTGKHFNKRIIPRIYEANELIEAELTRFHTYLKEVASLSETTLISHYNTVRQFLCFCSIENAIANGNKISPDQVRNFLMKELRHLSPASRKTILVRIRNYLRFLEFEDGFNADEILKLPMTPPVWKRMQVPKYLSAEDKETFLSTYNLNSEIGLRDYAIARCFSDLGLRCVEVANLSLDDFDWQNGTVCVHKTKNHSERKLPLSLKAGQSIVNYLLKARPNTKERTLFVRFKKSAGFPMGTSQVRDTMRRAAVRAGLRHFTGTHMFRHTVAKDMISSGTDIKTIADILGHETIETTMIYTKINFPELSFVAGKWPEVIV
ncbi:tyrosine-type recombinase/integrase [Desulfosporosinus burensis]